MAEDSENSSATQAPTQIEESNEPEITGLEPVERPAYDGPEAISWTASEFIAHEKSAGWYLAVISVAALISAVVYLITRDYVSVAVVIAAGLILAYYGSHKPRELNYKLDRGGLIIGQKIYHYDHFRSFSLIQEGAFTSITFMPLKRFAPPISIYYAPEDEARITALLSTHLPVEQHKRDAVDKLMHRIRF